MKIQINVFKWFIVFCLSILIIPFKVNAASVWTTSVVAASFNGTEQTTEAKSINNALLTYKFHNPSYTTTSFLGTIDTNTLPGASGYRNSFFQFSAENGGYFSLDGKTLGTKITIVHKQDWTGIANNLCASFSGGVTDGGSSIIDDSNCFYFIAWDRYTPAKTLSINSPDTVTPSSPTPTTAALSGSNSVNISWYNPSTAAAYSVATSIKIYRETYPITTPTNLIASSSPTLTTYTDSGLSPGTYIYYLSACNTAGCSTPTHFSSVTVLPLTPNAPTYVTTNLLSPITGMTGMGVTISWVDNSDNETSFKITKIVSGGTGTTLPLLNFNVTSYTDTAVYPGNTYYYSVQSCNGDICSASSTPVYIKIPAPLPMYTIPTSPTPTNAALSGSNSVNISWYNPSTAAAYSVATSIKIYRETSFVTTPTNIIVSLSPTTTTYTDSGLSPGTYTYYLSACNTAGCSTPTYFTPTKITVSAPVITIPNPPLPVSISLSGTSSINLAWSDNSSNETRFEIYRGTSDISSTLISTKDAGITSHTDINLPPGTYYYSIASCNTAGCSLRTFFSSSVAVVTTKTTDTTTTMTPEIPSAPIPSTNTLSGTNSVILTWVNPSPSTSYSSSTSIRIYRETSSVTTPAVPIATKESNITTYSDLGLAPGHYIYYLSACNTAGCSTPVHFSSTTIVPELTVPTVVSTSTDTISTTISLSTATTTIKSVEPVAPTSPSLVSAARTTLAGDFTNTIHLSWTDNSYNETRFRIYRYSSTGKNELPIVAANTTNYYDNNLAPGTYYYSLEACNIALCSTSVMTSLVNIPVLATTSKITTANKIIKGYVLSSDKTPIIGAEVVAYNDQPGVTLTGYTDTSGAYSITATLPGTWSIRVGAKNQTEVSWVPPENASLITFLNENTNETKEVNFNVTPLSSTINIIVESDDNSTVPTVGVTIDTLSSLDSQPEVSGVIRKIITKKTDPNNKVIVQTLPGKYYIRTSTLDTSDYSDTPETSVTVSNNETKTVTILLKKKTKTITSLLNGVVKFEDGTTTTAFVSAWSNEGGSVEARTLTDGNFSLNLVVGQTWHVKATKDDAQKSYVSDEQTIVSEINNKAINLTFAKNDSISLPETVTVKRNTTEKVSISSDDGTSFTLPANSITSNSGVNVQIKPTTEAPSLPASNVISTAYDITVKDDNGTKFTKLNKEAEILIPYDEKELKAKGVALKSVIPSYYDESIGTWVPVTKFIIDQNRKVFVLYVNHLTRFALIAAADTTAPSSPTAIVTDAITPTDVKITWKNPTQDFDHIKIYRSEKIGAFGDVIATEVHSNSFTDKTYSINGKTYYYTVRAVDTAGNESTNNSQIASTVTGNKFAQNNKTNSLLLPPGQTSVNQIYRKLSLGSEGDDVTLLQKALKFDGFYATGPITGYYGKRTENAVYRFQNYYKNELLIPNGYKTGTGVVGAITRKKINEIIAQSTQ